MSHLRECNYDTDISLLQTAIKKQCTDDEETCKRLPLIGLFKTFQRLWSGKILCDNHCDPSLIVILIEHVGPLEERGKNDIRAQLLLWVSGDHMKLECVQEQYQELICKLKKFILKCTTVETWNFIRRLYPTLSLHLRPPACSAFVAMLRFDDDFVERECPNEYYFKEMSVADAAVAASNWKFSGNLALLRFQGLAEAGMGIGAYTKTGDNMVCWGFAMEEGVIGSLKTVEGHQRRNLASKVVQILCQKVIALGCRPYVFIEDIETSYISEKFFSRLGFTLMKGCNRLQWGNIEI